MKTRGLLKWNPQVTILVTKSWLNFALARPPYWGLYGSMDVYGVFHQRLVPFRKTGMGVIEPCYFMAAIRQALERLWSPEVIKEPTDYPAKPPQKNGNVVPEFKEHLSSPFAPFRPSLTHKSPPKTRCLFRLISQCRLRSAAAHGLNGALLGQPAVPHGELAAAGADKIPHEKDWKNAKPKIKPICLIWEIAKPN